MAANPSQNDWKTAWDLRSDTIYLNHGSFGPSPRSVIEARSQWQTEMESQPMDFFVRKFADALLLTRQRLAEFLVAQPEDLVLVENATQAMNVIANSFPLQADDQVLLTDHEYGAVRRIWEATCRQASAEVTTVSLSLIHI